ncbi:molybdenum cofactor biosynthesis protein [Ammoniphilus oxalaticus]|uniref:Molybdenum cofactor biosynthesis protein n=1 Tax=Ammoniphilus oxalaticus TaxID=66863 RepID=A0A419SFN1_9BACL|nr:MogA/MoaB family molybdenum cofactor biosynthesis protein [Ammoniphilus oxalaticus]RKD22594.1 molybdenum cofactor biosynthesis protein [Ammoniphilus oxalaticus]
MSTYKIGVITSSNSIYRGERENDSVAKLVELLKRELDSEICLHRVVPDDIEHLKEAFIELIDREKVELLITVGGTGLSPEDVTPEATESIIDRTVPGLAEEMRRASLENSRRAMLTRAVSGTRGNTLVINFPGNPKGVEECFTAIVDQIPHALNIIQGKVGEGSITREETW